MELKQLDEFVYVSGQINKEHVARLAEMGFGHIVCNRPDGEAEDQPGYEQIASEADKYGMSCLYVPIVNSDITATHIRTMSHALKTSKLTLIYCRSGNRSTIMWALCSVAAGEPVDDVIKRARNAGFDVSQALAPFGA